ncbi:phage protein NinX family protein [Pseudomonas sp. NUPR-001]|uniref:phage protein NinX family protein n=1 Tax=Pseudomonas sp. NUPR-001 TaxID=3416058 RepID=UPI003F980DC4
MSDLIEVKAADLVGEPLNWSVAVAIGLNPSVVPAQYGVPARVFIQQEGMFPVRYKPAVDWLTGGPLLEKYAITVTPLSDADWRAEEHITHCKSRSTDYLTAAMRCLVLAEAGETVQVPKELLP